MVQSLRDTEYTTADTAQQIFEYRAAEVLAALDAMKPVKAKRVRDDSGDDWECDEDGLWSCVDPANRAGGYAGWTWSRLIEHYQTLTPLND